MSSSICGILALLAVVQAANGLNCYGCNSKDDGLTCDWGGIVAISYDTVQCSSGGFLDRIISSTCYKMEATSKNGKEYIARGCLPSGLPSNACNGIASAIGWLSSHSSDDGDSIQSLNCHTCETDYCNSARKISGATVIGFILTAVIFII